IAEAAIILGGLLFLYLMVTSFITTIDISGDIIALISFGFLLTYIVLRYSFTGIEYPEVATEKRYQKEKRSKIYFSIYFWIVFGIINTISNSIPANLEEILDIVGPATIAAVFFFVLNYLSLKKSYRKNKDLLDD